MNKRGFTLIEMMVSVAIFAVVMTIALGALLAMSESDRKAQSLKSVINNLNFSLESMTRTMRTGYAYHCDVTYLSVPLSQSHDCNGTSGGASSVAFTAATGQIYAYCLGSGSTCGAGTAILRSVNGGTYAPLTAAEVNISYLRFYVNGSASGDGLQPQIVVLLSGSVRSSGNGAGGVCGTSGVSCFNLQTSVTQRIYDQ